MTKVSKSTKIPSVFPVELEFHNDRSLFLRDVQGVRYFVTHKDHTPLSKEDVDAIIVERMDYWSIATKYLLTSV